MHGRKRKQKGEVVNPVETTKKQAKLKAYTKLSSAILKLRAAYQHVLSSLDAVTADPSIPVDTPAASAPSPASSTELEPTTITNELDEVTTNSLKATAKMAAVNPDFYTLWNFRRDILTRLLVQHDEEDDDNYAQRVTEISTVELNLTETALTKRNPKCYYAWHHRKWIVGLGFCNLRAELSLCARFLERDERNFHCWTYRRCVASSLNVSKEEEFQFTEELISRNFSNGSAWHQRTRVLVGGGEEVTLVTELEKLREAIYTEPDDQSSWMYHRWILSKLCEEKRSEEKNTTKFYTLFMERLASSSGISGGSSGSGSGGGGGGGGSGSGSGAEEEGRAEEGKAEVAAVEGEEGETKATTTERAVGRGEDSVDTVFQKEMAMCRELISVEPTCRWPRLQLVHMIDCCTKRGAGSAEMMVERVVLLESLLEVDPTHAKFYEYQLGRKGVKE